MRGGYRPNAGRKKGYAAKNAEEARRVLSEMVVADIKPIGEALIKKAKEGNVQATKELFDRAFGRSAQSMKIEDDRPMPIPIMGGLSRGKPIEFDGAFFADNEKEDGS